MKKILLSCLFFIGLVIPSSLFLRTPQVLALEPCSVTVKALTQGVPQGIEGYKNTFTIRGNLTPGESYNIRLDIPRLPDKHLVTLQADGNRTLAFEREAGEDETSAGSHTLKLQLSGRNADICEGHYSIQEPLNGCMVSRTPREPGINQTVTINFTNIAEKIFIQGTGWLPTPPRISEKISGPGGVDNPHSALGGSGSNRTLVLSDFKGTGQYSIDLVFQHTTMMKTLCRTVFTVRAQPGSQEPTVPGEGVVLSPVAPVDLTENGTCTGTRISTAIGCIPYGDPNTFAGWFLKWAIGIAGGIAFLMIIFSGFQIMTSSNNPQQLQTGRELLTAAVSGLILIIFSVFLLNLIGVGILGIPGLGSP